MTRLEWLGCRQAKNTKECQLPTETGGEGGTHPPRDPPPCWCSGIHLLASSLQKDTCVLSEARRLVAVCYGSLTTLMQRRYHVRNLLQITGGGGGAWAEYGGDSLLGYASSWLVGIQRCLTLLYFVYMCDVLYNRIFFLSIFI